MEKDNYFLPVARKNSWDVGVQTAAGLNATSETDSASESCWVTLTDICDLFYLWTSGVFVFKNVNERKSQLEQTHHVLARCVHCVTLPPGWLLWAFLLFPHFLHTSSCTIISFVHFLSLKAGRVVCWMAAQTRLMHQNILPTHTNSIVFFLYKGNIHHLPLAT